MLALVLLLVTVSCSLAGQAESPSTGADGPTLTPTAIPRWTPPEPVGWYEPLHERPVVLDAFGDGVRGDIVADGGGGSSPQRLTGPSGIAIDGDGTLYVADHSAATIRRVTADGVAMLAGSGKRGADGDGGPAVGASLLDPSWLLVDGSGAVFVSTINRIRRIDADGTIATVAGSGEEGFDGDGEQAALSALNGNAGMALDDKGNLYFADRGNHRVRRISRGGVITTVAGSDAVAPVVEGGAATSGRLQGPMDVAVAPDGTIYVAEFDGHRVLRLNLDGTVSVVAGTGTPGFSGDGGPGAAAQINSPRALAVDVEGNLYIGDWKNQAIRRIDTSGRIVTVAGLGTGRSSGGAPAMIAGLGPPLDLALGPGGRLYVLQQDTYTVSMLRAPSPDDPVLACQGDPAGLAPRPPPVQEAVAILMAGGAGPGYSGDDGPLAAAQFLSAESFAIAADGSIYIADTGNHRIRVVSPAGVVTTFAGTGEPGFSGDGGPSPRAMLSAPKALLLDSAGNLYFADSGNFRVRRIDRCGIIESIAGSGQPGDGGDGGLAVAAEFRDATGLAIDAMGNLYVADPSSDRVRVIKPDGTIATFAGTGQPGSGEDGGQAAETPLDGPSDVAIGADSTVYIAETRGQKIRAVVPDGTIWTVAGPSYAVPIEPALAATGDEGEKSETERTVFLATPISLIVDSVDRIYFAELTGGIVSAFAPDDDPRPVAGDPAGQGVSGDSALAVAIPAPLALDLDSVGNLYVLNTAGELWQVGDGNGVVGTE